MAAAEDAEAPRGQAAVARPPRRFASAPPPRPVRASGVAAGCAPEDRGPLCLEPSAEAAARRLRLPWSHEPKGCATEAAGAAEAGEAAEAGRSEQEPTGSAGEGGGESGGPGRLLAGAQGAEGVPGTQGAGGARGAVARARAERDAAEAALKARLRGRQGLLAEEATSS